MLASWQAKLDEASQLRKVAGRPATWDAGAVLAVGDECSWEASVSFDPSATPSFILGIVDMSTIGSIAEADGDLVSRLVKTSPQGCFVEVLATAGYPRVWRTASGRVKASFIDGFGAVASGLSVRYEDGEASFSSGYKRYGPHKLPPGDYRPCVLLCSLNASVQLACLRKRRRGAEEAKDPCPWKDRKLVAAARPRYARARLAAPFPLEQHAELRSTEVLWIDTPTNEDAEQGAGLCEMVQ